jgi:hypothetical protein
MEGMGWEAGWKEGEEWEGPKKGCVLDYMGLALWVGVGGTCTGWTEKRLVEGFAMEEGFVFLLVTGV